MSGPGIQRPRPVRRPVAEPPGGDERFRLIDVAMKRHRYGQDALIEVLHTAQELFGLLRDDVLLHVARGLMLPPSLVYGVATFYHLFRFTPKGDHTCTVCTGTACYVKGAETLLAVVEELTGALPGGTTPDGKVSLETARCIGSCSQAPIAIFDGEVVGMLSAEAVSDRVKGWIDDGIR